MSLIKRMSLKATLEFFLLRVDNYGLILVFHQVTKLRLDNLMLKWLVRHAGAIDDNEVADDNEVESDINSDKNLEYVDEIQTTNTDLAAEDDDDDDWL